MSDGVEQVGKFAITSLVILFSHLFMCTHRPYITERYSVEPSHVELFLTTLGLYANGMWYEKDRYLGKIETSLPNSDTQGAMCKPGCDIHKRQQVFYHTLFSTESMPALRVLRRAGPVPGIL